MSLLQYLGRRPLPLLGSALIVLLGLLASLLYSYHSQRNQEAQLSHYGQALAASTARQAVNATINQDMISLQVMLRELNQHPAVVGATIHNVENQLLVQSGYPPGKLEERDHLSFTAPVALHDNIAGYLRVAIEPPGLSPNDRQFYGLWTLCVLLAATLPWLPGAVERRRKAHPAGHDQPEGVEPAGEPVTLRLSLELLNLPLLYRQLNLDSFTQLVERLEHQLQGILALYGGQQRLLAGHQLLVDFAGRDASDCAFRALCSAHLLFRLAAGNPGPKVRLAARVHPLPDTGHGNLALDFITQHGENHGKEGDIFAAPELLDEALYRHLELAPDTGRLIAIKPPYQALLEKQQQQLQTL